MSDALKARILSDSPKKVLACDGGGIRGLMSVEILLAIESALRTKLGKDGDFVLADYFDFVCGTSTGAVIAACIAKGMSMRKVREFYLASGTQMFDKASLLKRLHYKYNDEPLAVKLRQELGEDATLGSPDLRSVLMMVMRNATTDSPWPVTNNPFAKYNDTACKDCNLNLPLWQLVRASTAAPTYFPPEVVRLGEGTPGAYSFIFVDGGVTAYNNPAFLAFQMVTARPYALNWKTGKEQLLIVSVGTGGSTLADAQLSSGDLNLLYNATSIPSALMNAASAGWDMACRTVGECLHGAPIDREFESMVGMSKDGTSNSTAPKLFTYMRYNPELSVPGLQGLGLGDIDPDDVRKLDSIEHIPQIQRVGAAYADQQVRIGHFESFT
ncbi:patatin-like phospholipase family protein [Variovorax sp. GT1P44]|uniref:patatin-like phospholipase family protein n=1 Tax=Variovorax sp. GT1P44 TaxID=3443742 RepID=UPI003F466D34